MKSTQRILLAVAIALMALGAGARGLGMKFAGHTTVDDVPLIRLNNGALMPQFGLGTYLISQSHWSKRTIMGALQAGYRHIDTAPFAANERIVGEAIRESGIPRDEIWVTTTLAVHPGDSVKASIDTLLQRMGIGYIDMVYLRHPLADGLHDWHELEAEVDAGRVRAIGISDYDFDDDIYTAMVDSMRRKPDAVQVVAPPYSPGSNWHQRLQQDNIVIECLYPLSNDKLEERLISDPLIGVIASGHGKTPMQIVMRWHVQQGYSVVPGTDNLEYIKELIDIFNFELSPEEMETIAMLGGGIHPSPALLQQLQRLIEGYELDIFN